MSRKNRSLSRLRIEVKRRKERLVGHVINLTCNNLLLYGRKLGIAKVWLCYDIIMEDYIIVLSKLSRTIRTSKKYWQKIVTIKHPVMFGKERHVIKSLEDPVLVRQSDKDQDVCLYYGSYGKRYICVVVRHEDGTGFVISCYPVDKIKKGKILYEKTKSLS